jgi:tape measure domain-containing protein
MSTSNVLEFYIKMKDMMSVGLVSLSRQSNTSFGQIQKNIDVTVQKNNALAASFNNVDNKAKSSITSIVGHAKTIGAVVGAAGAVAFAKSSVMAAANYGARKKSFGVLTGSDAKGNDLADSLNKLQQDTILGPEVFKNAQTLLGFGINAKKILPDMKMLGDISMGDADRLGSLTLAFAQVGAAGKLSGQDLLQFVNAGFNPLQEISIKTGKSMGQLRKDMEDGKITFGMVESAMISATSAGGKFNGMMDQMAGTTFGRIQILSGAFENFKINVGNALVPVAEGLMQAAGGAMQWLDISKAAPRVLADELSGVNGLVSSIVSLNKGNSVRNDLLGQLKAGYPSLFGNLDAEKASNLELLGILNNINLSYKDKIAFANTTLQKDSLAKETAYTMGLVGRAQQQLQYMKSGHDGFFDTGMFSPYMQGFDNVQIRKFGFNEKSTGGLQDFINFAMNDLQRLDKDRNANQLTFAIQNAIQSNKAATLSAPDALKWLTDGHTLKGDAWRVTQLQKQINDHLPLSGGMQAFVEATQGRMQPSDIIIDKDKDKNNKITNDMVRGVTSGGPRTINISGVTMKLAEKIEVNAKDAKDFYDQLEPQMENMWLRLLNSGRSVS